MAKKYKLLAQLLLMSLGITCVIFILARDRDEIAALLSVDYDFLGLLLLVNTISLVLFSHVQYYILKSRFNIALRSGESFALASLAAFYNQVAPAKLGSIVRYGYLNKVYLLELPAIIFATIIQMYYFFVSVFLVLAAAIVLNGEVKLGADYSLYILIAACSVTILLWSEKYVTSFFAWRTGKFATTMVPTSGDYRLLLYSILLVLLRALMLLAAFGAVDYQMAFSEVLFLACALLISNSVNVLPGNLALRELILGFLMSFYGHDLSVGIIVSLLDRLGTVLVLLIVVLPSKWNLMQQRMQ